MSDYEALKAAGHSAAMALVIILDANRGDKFCINWIAETRAQVAAKSKEATA